MPNGNLVVFDNGYNRNFSSSSDQYGCAVEFNIEETPGYGRIVKQAWQFGKELGFKLIHQSFSDVDYLLIPRIGSSHLVTVDRGVSNHAVTIEIDKAGVIIFEANIVFKNGFSNGQADIVYRQE